MAKLIPVFLALACLFLGSSASAQSSTIRIRSGAGAYTDTLGNIWAADNSYVNGVPYAAGSTITGTPDQALYQAERYAGTFGYAIAVPNGTYNVTLKFAEWHWTQVNQRKFSLSANGTPVASIQSFDIVAAAGAANKAVDRTFPVTVTNGTLTLSFTSQVDNAKVDAIQVVLVATPTPTATSTATATPTNTPVPTVTPTDTPTPVVGPTDTPAPTATPAPVQTCEATLTLNGVTQLFTRPLSECADQ